MGPSIRRRYLEEMATPTNHILERGSNKEILSAMDNQTDQETVWHSMGYVATPQWSLTQRPREQAPDTGSQGKPKSYWTIHPGTKCLCQWQNLIQTPINQIATVPTSLQKTLSGDGNNCKSPSRYMKSRTLSTWMPNHANLVSNLQLCSQLTCYPGHHPSAVWWRPVWCPMTLNLNRIDLIYNQWVN